MSAKPDPVNELTAQRRRQIEKIHNACAEALSESISEGSISEEERSLAEQALLEIQVGVGLARELSEKLQVSDPATAMRMDNIIATIMKGLFVCGGLVLTSKTARDLARKQYNKDRVEGAHKTLSTRKDWHKEAIRHALSQPPSRPLQSRRGASAIAVRALRSANAWLSDQRERGLLTDDAVASLTEGAIQKRIAANPADFPLSDIWQK